MAKASLHPFADPHLVTDDRFRDDSVPNTRWYGPSAIGPSPKTCCPEWTWCASITTNVGGIPELIEHGRTGYIFDSGDDASFIETIVELARLRSCWVR
jgi:hypothetical protein